jgi:hypothetical protein
LSDFSTFRDDGLIIHGIWGLTRLSPKGPCWRQPDTAPLDNLLPMKSTCGYETLKSSAMADDLSDEEIALLCDVLEGHGANLNADKTKILDQLIAKGFVVATDQESPEEYKLTSKAQQLLAERGVGLSGG